MAETISSMRARLRSLTTDWLEDGSHPPNYVKETGMGDELARVDRWCGGYQDVHEPVIIGWRAQVGNRRVTGTIRVDYRDPSMATKKQDIDAAINLAKTLATKALARLQSK